MAPTTCRDRITSMADVSVILRGTLGGDGVFRVFHSMTRGGRVICLSRHLQQLSTTIRHNQKLYRITNYLEN